MAERKAARRRRILDAAVRLFGERGYHSTTVPMIVESAASSTGSFYSYFDNKEDVFVAAVRDVGDALSRNLNEAIDRHQRADEQLRAAVEALFLFLAGNPPAARILVVESASQGGRVGAVRREILDSHVRSVRMALSSLSNGFSGERAEVAAWCWVGAVHEAVTRWLARPPDRRGPATEIARWLAEFNLRAVGAEAVRNG